MFALRHCYQVVRHAVSALPLANLALGCWAACVACSTGFVKSLRNGVSRPRAERTVFVQFHSSYMRCSYLVASVQLTAFVCISVGACDACGAGSHPGDCTIAKRTRAETGLGLGRRTQGALRSAVLPFYSSSMAKSDWLGLLSMCCTCLSACECPDQHCGSYLWSRGC